MSDSKLNDSLICSICLEVLNCDITTTVCKHKYHNFCIDSWIKQTNPNPTCPECRAEIYYVNRTMKVFSDVETMISLCVRPIKFTIITDGINVERFNS